MTDNTRVNEKIFTSEQQPLFSESNTANMTKYYSFNALPQKTVVWTPSPQKCINLAAVQASAPLGVTIILSSDDEEFMALRITDTSTTVSQSFPSAYRLMNGNTISLSTSDEETVCETFGAASATQVAYNSRSDFTNVANAAGLPNGQYATLTSALLIGTSGRIVLDYNMIIEAASQLQIESVVIKFYCRLSLTLAVGTSSMIFYWRPDPTDAWIELQQASLSLIGTLNYLTSPLEQDITAAVLSAADPWEVITSLQTSFVGVHTGLGLGNTIQLDAVVVEVCVTGINKITLVGFET